MDGATPSIGGATPVPQELREGAFLVIAAYNEGSAIEAVVREAGAVYPNIVVVDDGSADDTAEVASRAARYVLRHVVNRGQGAALQTGITFALKRGARYIVTFDADGQHRVEDVRAMLEPIVSGECDITLGSRFLGEAVGLPASRKLTLKAAVLFTRVFNRVRLTDAHNGLRGFSARAASRIDMKLDRMAHASEIIDQIRHSGMRYKEVAVEIRYTEYSLAKGQSSRQAFKIVFHYLVGRILR
jgi:glycosyltransferase involved in cell wall biosynthesis